MLENVVRKINDKGWNLYEFTGRDRLLDSITKGSVNKLAVGGNYVLFPRIDEDRDLLKVKAAMDDATERQVLPIANYLGVDVPLVHFTLKDKEFIVHAVGDISLSYDSFSSLLNNLCSFRYIA